MELSAPQNIFLNELDTKFRAYVGGFGSGKTFVGCLDLLIFFSRHPGTVQGYFGPTYPSIRDIFYPTFEEAAELMGFRVKTNVSNKEVAVYRGKKYYGTAICRSMENPDSIVGFKIARALVDEIDVLNPLKATNAWRKIIARMRLNIEGVVNSIGVTTTPEGFKFVYEQFANNPTESYSMVQASTYENERFLPPDYISSLIETYPKELINAYLKGLFVNLTSGTVYKSYDRAFQNSFESIQGNEPLHIGMDFNVTKQAATIYVHRKGKNGAIVWHAVEELVDMYDTPDSIKIINEKWPNNKIHIYPDASGANRKSVDASVSDLSMLEQAGYTIHVNRSNPAVKDRINAVNAALEGGLMLVNSMRCPTTSSNLEQQIYDDNGQPDKKSGKDHQNDATGYPIAYSLPIRKPVSNIKIQFAI
tara:strand:- start:1459 stop:2715 length:1257 start_codon:yes stop_codon:yes gene_type:complete